MTVDWRPEYRKSQDMTEVGKDKKRRRSVRIRRLNRDTVVPEQVKLDLNLYILYNFFSVHIVLQS